MCHLCAILNGIAGIIVFSAPSALSAAWFPPNERTTATAIGIAFNNLGNAASFFLGPAIVPDPSRKDNKTDGDSFMAHYGHDVYRVPPAAAFSHSSLMAAASNDTPLCPVIDPAENELITNRIFILMVVGKR